MTKRKWIIFGTALAAFAVVFWAVTARHETPPGQPQLAVVTQQTLLQVKEEFNASVDSERVVLLLSPTCPVCIQGSSVVNDILRRHPENKIRVIAIWEPMLPTDWNRPTTAVLDRLSDRRAIQWWDNQHIIAGLLKASAGKENPGCCKRNETLWDVISVYPPGMKWTETLPSPAFFAGPVVRGAPKWEAQLKDHLAAHGG
jgi:hypothetical protein